MLCENPGQIDDSNVANNFSVIEGGVPQSQSFLFNSDSFLTESVENNYQGELTNYLKNLKSKKKNWMELYDNKR